MTDFSCQSEFGIDSSSQCFFERHNEILLETQDIKLLVEDDQHSYAEEFKTSLQKLDHLIQILNNVYSTCKQSQTVQSLDVHTQQEHVTNSANMDTLAFNINMKDKNCVHCHAKKGKYSLKIIDTSTGKSKLNPFSLHRCTPTLEISDEFNKKGLKNLLESCGVKSKKIYSDINFKNTFQIQKSFNTHSTIEGCFTSSLLQHVLAIKTDLQGLKKIFNNAQCMFDSKDSSRVTFKIGDLSSWLLQTRLNVEKSILSEDDIKLIHGKIRASHFCKFYKMFRTCRKKKQNNKVNIKAVTT